MATAIETPQLFITSEEDFDIETPDEEAFDMQDNVDVHIEVYGRLGPETEDVYLAAQRVAERVRREYGVLVSVTMTITDWSMGHPIFEGPRVYVNGELLEVDPILDTKALEERLTDLVLAMIGEGENKGVPPESLNLLTPRKDRQLIAVAAVSA